ncbi:unnamed protein product [Phytophthora fragariaefolia]|uniref:Unnamed protein product n=1 Tax=Phytophthora fragariaefolia TaxID=1490495 RepID=A0A9W6WN16_9STRA|nr:unnamed protein product [Phytophthora fragariaefolia]
MSFARMRSMFDSHQRGWSGSQFSDSSRNTFNPAQSFSTQNSEDSEDRSDMINLYKPPSDTEMLNRARTSHNNTDFVALEAGPESGGPWQRVEIADRFVVFKRPSSAAVKESRLPGLEVMCVGPLDASLEEVASVLRSNSEIDHANTMEALHAKDFIFGSLDREVPCSGALLEQVDNQDEDSGVAASEQLNVKTTSFLRTTVFGHNEQWCFSDFFQRNKERDGFSISQCALPPHEPTPGRVVRVNARVDQLHGLNASYLVNQLPNRRGLRVVYNAWFEEIMSIGAYTASSYKSRSGRRRSSGLSVTSSSRSNNIEASTTSSESQSSSRQRSSGVSVVSSTSSTSALSEAADGKAQLRRLLSLAHGITKLPELIRRRRFGMQVPVDFDAVQVANTRCPCCTHSLAPVKMSLSLAASAIAKRSLRALKIDTRRCYLCGYLVCIDCWSAEYMESSIGRVASIVVCSRCHAAVNACEYSEAYDSGQDNTRGPVKVVADEPESSPASLLTDFLSASLANAPVGRSDRTAIVLLVRTLLRQSESIERESYEVYDDDSDYDGDEDLNPENQNNNVTFVELGKYLSDESQYPELESCVFANSKRRGYTIDLPDDPVTMVPPTVIPSHEQIRLQLTNDKGLMLLAHQLAPLDPSPGLSFDDACDVHDLDILCQLAVRASGCANAFVSIMGTEHLHILSSSNPDFRHATMPREHTVCQHTIMTPKPFIISHPEADVRFHQLGAIKALSTRCYMGFPLNVSIGDEKGDEKAEMPVGTLCCVDPTARSELTHSQYTNLTRLADTASRLIQLKSRQLLRQQTF